MEGRQQYTSENVETVADTRAGDRRVCPACGAANISSDAYCTACGAAVPSGSPEEGTVEFGRPVARLAPVAVLPSTHANARPRRSRLAIVLALAATAALGAAVVLAVLWHAQTQQATRLQHQLDRTTAQLTATRSKLAATRSELVTTESKLAATRRLSARRGAVLVKAEAVLKKVDPLLSDADGIKQITSEIQTARDTFAADSTQMTSDLIALENYEANPQDYPTIDEFALVDQVTAELDTVRSDYAALTSSDGDFSDASTSFGNHADAFTNAVRSLQTQLNAVAGS